jgi:hypothetical protein
MLLPRQVVMLYLDSDTPPRRFLRRRLQRENVTRLDCRPMPDCTTAMTFKEVGEVLRTGNIQIVGCECI